MNKIKVKAAHRLQSTVVTAAASATFKASTAFKDLPADPEKVVKFLMDAAEAGERIYVHEIPTAGKDVMLYKGFPHDPGLYTYEEQSKAQFNKMKATIEKKIRAALDSHDKKFSFVIHDSKSKPNRMGVTWFEIDHVLIEYTKKA